MLSRSTPDASLMAVSLDACLHVVNTADEVNEDEDDAKVSVLLESPADALAWTMGNTFVLAALRSGKLQVRSLEFIRNIA